MSIELIAILHFTFLILIIFVFPLTFLLNHCYDVTRKIQQKAFSTRPVINYRCGINSFVAFIWTKIGIHAN